MAFEQVTGVAAPPSQINKGSYRLHAFPWFRLYDEHVPAARIDTNTLNAIKPLDQFGDDQLKRKRDFTDPTTCIGCSDAVECALFSA